MYELTIHNSTGEVTFVGEAEEHIRQLRKMADEIESGMDGGDNWVISELSADEEEALRADIGL